MGAADQNWMDSAAETDSELESVAHESDFLLDVDGRRRPQKLEYSVQRRPLFVVGGSIVLVGSALLLLSGLPARTTHRTTTMRELLDSDALQEVSTDNFMRLSHGARLDRDIVRFAVAKSFKNITARLEKESPALHRRLSRQRLSAAQQLALLQRVQSMGDPRVQKLGLEVARAIRAGVQRGRTGVKQQLLATFGPKLGEIRALRDEVVPALLRGGLDRAGFDADGMKMLKSIPDEWNGDLRGESSHNAARQLSTSASQTLGTNCKGTFFGSGKELSMEQGLGIVAGLLEEVRVLLDDLDFVGAAFDNNGKIDKGIPFWSKSGVGGADFLVQVLDCVMRTDDKLDPTTGKEINTCNFNTQKMMMCPMKYASAAADFFSSLDNLMGIDNHKYAKGDTSAQGSSLLNSYTTDSPSALPSSNYFLTAPPR